MFIYEYIYYFYVRFKTAQPFSSGFRHRRVLDLYTVPTDRALRHSCSRYIRALEGAGPPEAIGEKLGATLRRATTARAATSSAVPPIPTLPQHVQCESARRATSTGAPYPQARPIPRTLSACSAQSPLMIGVMTIVMTIMTSSGQASWAHLSIRCLSSHLAKGCCLGLGAYVTREYFAK